MNDHTTPLSPRHERFVHEFLKDGNATQAYLRAGYSPRGAQQSASRLLRDPRIETAIAAGRQRIARDLEVDVQRIAQEYAKIAFASVCDYLTTGEDGRLRVDLEKANQAQRAGIVEVRITDNSKQQQTVTLKLGKLQALNMLVKQLGVLAVKPAPGLTEEDRQAYEQRCADLERLLNHREEQQRRLQRELDEIKLRTGIDNPNPSAFARSSQPEADEDIGPAEPPPDPPKTKPRPKVMPGMPTEPMPDFRPGLYPNAKFIFSGGRQHRLGTDSADALRAMDSGGFDELGFSEECEESIKEIEAWIRGE
jgi:phage terminase small subunit